MDSTVLPDSGKKQIVINKILIFEARETARIICSMLKIIWRYLTFLNDTESIMQIYQLNCHLNHKSRTLLKTVSFSNPVYGKACDQKNTITFNGVAHGRVSSNDGKFKAKFFSFPEVPFSRVLH